MLVGALGRVFDLYAKHRGSDWVSTFLARIIALLLLTLLDEALETLPTIRRTRLAPKTDSNSRKNSAFAAAVVPNDKVDKRAKRYY